MILTVTELLLGNQCSDIALSLGFRCQHGGNLGLRGLGVLIEQGELTRAILLLDSLALELPRNHQVFGLLARAYYVSGDFARAAKAAERARLLMPEHKAYSAALARSLFKLGDAIGTENAWRVALADGNAPPAWYAGFAAVCQVNGRLEDALLAYEKAIASSSAPPRKWSQDLATCALRMGDKARALEAFRMAAAGGGMEVTSIISELERQGELTAQFSCWTPQLWNCLATTRSLAYWPTLTT